MTDTQGHPDGGSRAEGSLTEGRHTPGPWRAIRASELDDTPGVGRMLRDLNGWLVVAPGSVVCVHVEEEANARLIAQAPDLLAERDRLRQQNAELREALRLMGCPFTYTFKLCSNQGCFRCAALARCQP